MPWFALQSDRAEYQLGHHLRIPADRPVLSVEFGNGVWMQPYSFIDTGAPLSVISSFVARNIAAHSTLHSVPPGAVPATRNGVTAMVPTAQLLTWRDPSSQTVIPCDLVELTVRLRNRTSGIVSDPLTLVAKLLRQPAQAFNDHFVLLGTHFLTANAGQLHLEGQPWGLGGPGLFFPP